MENNTKALTTINESSPVISLSEAIHLAQKLYGLETDESSCEQLMGYFDKNIYMKGTLGNSRYSGGQGLVQEFVFKVMNGVESQDKGLLDAQTKMMKFLHKNGINCPTVVQSLKGNYDEWVQLPFIKEEDQQQEDSLQHEKKIWREQTWHSVRLQRYIPGILFSSIRPSYSLDLFYDVGRYAGKLICTLQDFSNEALKSRFCICDLKNVREVQKYEHVVKNKNEKEVTRYFFRRLTTEFVPMLENIPLHFIHSDMSENNLLVEKDKREDEYRVSGLLDFGDIAYSHRLFEPAVASAYMMMEHYPNNVLETSGYTVAGFQSVLPLSNMELTLIPLAMAGRILTSVLMGLYGYTVNPENDCFLLTQKNGWPVLQILMETPEEEIFKTWRRIFDLKNIDWPT